MRALSFPLSPFRADVSAVTSAPVRYAVDGLRGSVSAAVTIPVAGVGPGTGSLARAFAMDQLQPPANAMSARTEHASKIRSPLPILRRARLTRDSGNASSVSGVDPAFRSAELERL